jgi:hypothetical protein
MSKRPSKRGRVVLADGSIGLTTAAVARRLVQHPTTIQYWKRQGCRWREGRKLMPEPGWTFDVYRESLVAEIEAAMKAARQPPGRRGETVSRDDLVRSLWGTSKNPPVNKYEQLGLLHRDKQPPADYHNPVIRYPREECDRLKRLLDDRKAGRFWVPKGDHKCGCRDECQCLTIGAAEKSGCGPRQTMLDYEKPGHCHFLERGQLVPEFYTDPTILTGTGRQKIGRGRGRRDYQKRRRGYRVCDLDAIRKAKKAEFDGEYRQADGTKNLTLERTGELIDRKPQTVRQYMRPGRCPLLPEGQSLPAPKMRRRVRRAVLERTVTEDYAKRLAAAMSEAVNNRGDGEWQTSVDLCRNRGIKDKKSIRRVRSFLSSLPKAKVSRDKRPRLHKTAPPKSGRDSVIRRLTHFKVEELDRLLANRPLDAAAKQFSLLVLKHRSVDAAVRAFFGNGNRQTAAAALPVDGVGQDAVGALHVRAKASEQTSRRRGRPGGSSQRTKDRRQAIRNDLATGFDVAQTAARNHCSKSHVRNVRAGLR